jgi:cytochrome oxidase assembly protein ShyY1
VSWVRRWGGYVALTIVFAIACGLLSWWQWSRRAEAVAEIERIEANYDAQPARLSDLLPDLDTADESVEWHPVVLQGEYLADEELYVRNRPRNANPGYEVLVPFRLQDGTVFVVDRGWVPLGDSPDGPDPVPAPPEGEVTVVVRLREGEPEIAGRSAPPGQLATIHLPDVAELLDEPTYTGMYGLLAEEDPAPASAPWPALHPEEDEGPHLSYALQWIAFGVLAFVGLVWAIRRERRIAALPPEEQAAARRPVRRSRDSDEEDAILDAAGR